MKFLFFMSHAGAARNFESTLRGLAENDHQVHMAFDRMEKKNLPGLWDLANSLIAEYPGITAGEHPQPPRDDWSLVSSRLRLSLDYMRFQHRDFRDAPKLRQRAAGWVPERGQRLGTSAPPPARAMIRAAFRSAERATPVSEVAESYVRDQQPDAILVTPFLEPGNVQVEFVRAANRMNIPTCLCVHSWDNLTNKGLIHEVPDVITVWNEMQRDEAVDLHRVPADRVVVTGASPYDHWFGWEPSRSREEFAASVGLDPARPFVAYLGSSGFIAPDEAGFIVEWAGELREQGLGDMQVLARPHPVNPLLGSGSTARLLQLDNVKLYPPAGANPTDEDSRRDYFDSLYYCSAATGVNTTAFLEAAIVGRPVITLLAPRHSETQLGTLHFKHLLTAGGGLLHVADTYEEHATQLREALAAPHPDGCVSERSARFTEAFIRPYGLEEPATPRMIATLEELPERNHASRRVTLTGKMLARVARMSLARAQRRRRRAKLRRDRKARSAVIEAKKYSAREKAARAKEKMKAAGADGAKDDAAMRAMKAKSAQEKAARAREKRRVEKERAAISERSSALPAEKAARAREKQRAAREKAAIAEKARMPKPPKPHKPEKVEEPGEVEAPLSDQPDRRV